MADAAWAIFLNQLTYKAASANRVLVQVDARGTSQTCPDCGRIKKKLLSERTHRCDCGLEIDRDLAASRVILARAVDGNRGTQSGVEGPTSVPLLVVVGQASPVKRLEHLAPVSQVIHCHRRSVRLERPDPFSSRRQEGPVPRLRRPPDPG